MRRHSCADLGTPAQPRSGAADFLRHPSVTGVALHPNRSPRHLRMARQFGQTAKEYFESGREKYKNDKVTFIRLEQLYPFPVKTLANILKRYTKAELDKNPELRGKDIKAMEKSFERFSRYPVSIFSFAEGTRFTEKKKLDQSSKYKNLLNPKSGGIGLTLTLSLIHI